VGLVFLRELREREKECRIELGEVDSKSRCPCTDRLRNRLFFADARFGSSVVPITRHDKTRVIIKSRMLHVSQQLKKPLSACFPIRVYVDQQEEKEVGEVYCTALIRSFFKLQIYLWYQEKKLKKEDRCVLFEKLS
jgi:hypothetical protein